jgi:hypothetical protein
MPGYLYIVAGGVLAFTPLFCLQSSTTLPAQLNAGGSSLFEVA